jgi:hypothetical protein
MADAASYHASPPELLPGFLDFLSFLRPPARHFTFCRRHFRYAAAAHTPERWLFSLLSEVSPFSLPLSY